MNGKIKTKFAALFAVALMITVCVVPVVGNEDVQAVVTDPSDAVSLTVSGKVFDSTGNVGIDKIELQITVGSENYKVYSSGSSYEQEVYVPKDTVISNVTVKLNATSKKIVDGSGNEVANGAYGLWTSDPALTYTNVVMDGAKEISDVDFIAGYKTISGSLKYKNGGTYGKDVTVALYEMTTGATPEYNTTGYSTTSSEGSFVLYVPAGLTASDGKSFVLGAEIPGFAVNDVQSNKSVAPGTNNWVIKSPTEYVFKISASPYANGKQVVEDTIKMDESGSKIVVSEESVTVNDENKEKYIVFTDAAAVEGTDSRTMNVKFTGIYGSVDGGEKTISKTDVTTVTYTQKNYIGGTVKMGDIGAQEGTVKLSLKKSDGTVIDTYTSSVKNGTFGMFYENDASSAKYQLKYESGDFVKENTEQSMPTTAVTDSSIAVDPTGYVKVTGNVVRSDGTIGVSKVNLTVEGSDIFGLKSGVVATGNGGAYSFMVPKDQVVKITPDTAYKYDVESVQVQASSSTLTVDNFKMKDKKVEISFQDYDGKPLSGVSIHYATYSETTEAWSTSGSGKSSTTNGIATLEFPGNVDLSSTYVVFDMTGRTFANDKDSTPLSPIAISSITSAVKVLDTYNVVEIVDASGKTLVPAENKDVYVKKHEAILNNGVKVFGDGTKVVKLSFDQNKEHYYFIGVIGNQTISTTKNTVLAVDISTEFNTQNQSYIFDPVNVLATTGSITKITAYADSISGTVYEADEKTVIKTLGGSEVTLYIDGNSNSSPKVTGVVNKDGTFAFNSYYKLNANSQIEITSNNSSYSFDVVKALDGGEKVKSFYADETTFSVTFTDADGKAIKYTNATVNEERVVDGKVILEPVENSTFTLTGFTDRTFNNYAKMTESMISSKKIDFVSDQATYTVNVTDSEGKIWDYCNVGFDVYNVNDVNNYSLGNEIYFASDDYDIETGKNTLLMTVPAEGKLAVKNGLGSEYKDYFSQTELYVFENYQVTVPAIGSFVEVTAAEANGKMFRNVEVVDTVDIYEVGAALVYNDIAATNNVVEYFAVDGKSYEFTVTPETGEKYTFGDSDVNDGKISVVDGLLLANEETVSGKVTFANGYNDFTGFTGTVTAKYVSNDMDDDTSDMAADGSYKIIVDVDKVEKYEATINTASRATTSSVAGGSSSTPEIVLDESYITGSAPSDDVEAAVYKDGAFVKSLNVQVNDGKYVLIVDASDGDEIVMTITASGKTFQQAIDLKAVQNDIIVPGTLVSDKTDALFADYYVIYGADTAVIGSKIVLSAKNAVSIQMDVNNVAYQTFVFDGWYVNGEKVSDDVNATYTVNGPCEVYAYYTEKVTETGAVADSSNDLSMDVLILGIVIVVLALLAFVYAVKFKKE